MRWSVCAGAQAGLRRCCSQTPKDRCSRGEAQIIYWLSFFSFFLYILPGARFRALSAGVHCTLRVAGWKPTSDHIEITAGFFNLHKGWLSLHRGHPVNVPIRRTMHLSSVIPANDTRESNKACSDSEIFLAASGDRTWDLSHQRQVL